MKVVVSHIGKQHVNALLAGLTKHGALQLFFTAVATNKFSFTKYLSAKWQSKLKKRAFTDIQTHQIKHFPWMALLTNGIKSEYYRTFIAYKWFDKMVAHRLKRLDFDIFISYENINLESFKVVKELGKTTVLDLAAIHHSFQNPVLMKLGTYERTAELDRICAQKEAALRYTDYILTLSNYAEQTLIASGFPAKRIFRTYLGVNHSVFQPKKSYNTEGGVFELYFVGTMTTRKGLPFLFLIHKTLLERGLNVRLTLIGPLDDFKPPTEETPQYRYIPFLNHVELVKMHHELDLFLFPSYLDSWGQVVVEAMACGSPVLVSDCTGAKDAVEKGGGDILPVDDLNAWLSIIEKYYYNRFLLEKIGKQGVVAAKDFTWEAYHEQVVQAMLSISKKKIEPVLFNS